MTVLHLVAKDICVCGGERLYAGWEKGVGMKGEETRGCALVDYEKDEWSFARYLLCTIIQYHMRRFSCRMEIGNFMTSHLLPYLEQTRGRTSSQNPGTVDTGSAIGDRPGKSGIF